MLRSKTPVGKYHQLLLELPKPVKPSAVIKSMTIRSMAITGMVISGAAL